MAFQENLSDFFADDGVIATKGAASGKVLLDQADEAAMMEEAALSTDYVITYPTSLFPGLIFKDAIVVDGANYTVRSARKVSDGKISKAYLSKV